MDVQFFKGDKMKEKAKVNKAIDCTMALATSIAGMLLIIALTCLERLLNNNQY